MTESVKTLAILNLTGELSRELVEYFNARSITVIDPLQNHQSLDWTHILTKDIHDFSLIRETYQTLEKDIKIISLSSVQDQQSFILSNGKLIFDELWLKGELGPFILDKFFQEYAGITLGDNYPTFKELGSFNITNPFNTGEYLDRMTYHAFQEGVDALSIKTSFDHLLMFLTGLKNKGRIGLPIEVTYGKFESVFGFQLHFFTQDLMLEDVTSCLSSTITKKPEEYLFNIAIQSSDFFDFTFLGEVKKAVVTALWTQDARIKFENRGLMFTHLDSASQITGFHSEEVSSFLVKEAPVEDFSDRIHLPESSSQKPESERISGEKFSEALAEKISSSMEMEKIKQIVSGNFNTDEFSELISGTPQEEEAPQVVKGSLGEDDVKIVIRSQDSMDEIVNLVKGKVEEEKSVFIVSGGKFDPDNFAYRITAGLTEKIKGDQVLKSKVLGQQLPQTIKQGLFDFAKKLNKELHSLSENDLDAFKNFEVPQLIKQHTQVDEMEAYSVLTKEGQVQAKSFFNEFKSSFQEVLKDEFQEDSIENVISNIKTETDALKVKQVLKETLKKSLDEKFHLSEKNKISENEQEVLVKALTSSLDEQEDKIRTILETEKKENIEKEVTPLFREEKSFDDKKMEQQNKLLHSENENLKSKIKTLMSEIRLAKEAKAQIAQIQDKAQKAVEAIIPSADHDPDEALRAQFQHQLMEQKALTEQDAVKLASLLERETKLIADIKQEEMKSKRLQIEQVQKEAFFTQEIEKNQRLLKAKDTLITKSKETLTKISERKDYEIRDLQQKLDQLNKALAGGQQQNQMNVIRDLERENANMTKMIDVYRNKVSSLASNISRQSNRADDGKLKDEVRKLQTTNNQLKNISETAKKEMARFKEKSEQDSALITMLKQDKTRLEQIIKKTTLESKPEATPGVVVSPHEQDLRRAEAQAQMLETQLKEAIQRCKDYEMKISELQRSQRMATTADDPSKVKVTQLENSVKKLTQDLVDSRNQLSEMKKDTNKLRQEKTALQNQLDKIKKDMDKSKAAPKKTNGRAA